MFGISRGTCSGVTCALVCNVRSDQFCVLLAAGPYAAVCAPLTAGSGAVCRGIVSECLLCTNMSELYSLNHIVCEAYLPLWAMLPFEIVGSRLKCSLVLRVLTPDMTLPDLLLDGVAERLDDLEPPT